MPSGITAPGSATATIWPAATLGAPQTIGALVAGPDVDRADGQPVGVRVALGAQHAADEEVLERADAVRGGRASTFVPVIVSRCSSSVTRMPGSP